MLVGLPGAGKSTLGELVARRLGQPFVDLDREIERWARRSISELIVQDGEAAFRELEVRVTAHLARSMGGAVVAAGGGWMANSAAVEPFRPRARIIYLRASVDGSVARLGRGIADRPLLAGRDPSEALAQLLAARESAYGAADAVLDVEGFDLQRLTERLLALAEEFGVP